MVRKKYIRTRPNSEVQFMKIVIFADSHREYQKLKNIVEKNLDADLFIHLGDGEHELRDMEREHPDKKFVFVKGECDYGVHDTEKVIDLNTCKIYCTHGDLHGLQSGLDSLIFDAKKNGCKIALYGHTHFYRTEFIDGVYIMNPGSIDSPRGHNPASYGIIQIDDSGKITMNIVASR